MALRIAILTPFASADVLGGIEVFNRQLAECFPGVRIFSYTPFQSRDASPWGLDRVGLEHPRRAWSVSRRFFQEHRRRPHNLVVCNGMYGWPLQLLPANAPVVQVYHYTLAGLAQDAVLEPGLAWVDRHIGGAFEALSGRGQVVVTVSARVREEVRRFYRLDGTVIPNGVDVDRFRRLDRDRCREELGLPKDQLVGLYVGRPDHIKGFDIFMEVVRRRKDILFLVVGPCPETEPNMIVRPRVPYGSMPTVYSAADFLLVPSRYEGFGLAVVEALACDLPVIANRRACPLDEGVGPSGVLVDGLDPRVYLEAIETLSTPAEATSTHDRVASEYSLGRFRERWRSLVDGLVS